MIDFNEIPLPDVDEPDLAPYWEAAAREELIVRACDDCRRAFWPPRPACRHCGSLALGWRSAGTTGRLFTWTVIGHTSIPGFREAVPFAVAVVELDAEPGVRMVGRVTSPADALAIDARVQVRFERVDDRITLPVWELA